MFGLILVLDIFMKNIKKIFFHTTITKKEWGSEGCCIL